LDENPELGSTTALRALVTCARGEMAAVDRKSGEAIALFRFAIQQWHAIGAPVPAARARWRVADLLMAEGDDRAAEMERTAAAHAFAKAGATCLLLRMRQSAQSFNEDLPQVA